MAKRSRKVESDKIVAGKGGGGGLVKGTGPA